MLPECHGPVLEPAVVSHQDVPGLGQVLEDDRAGRPAGMATQVPLGPAGAILLQLVLLNHVPEVGDEVDQPTK